MGPDDLLDFHNELFPEEPESELDPKDGVAAVRKKVTDYLGRGLEIEETLDLWHGNGVVVTEGEHLGMIHPAAVPSDRGDARHERAILDRFERCVERTRTTSPSESCL